MLKQRLERLRRLSNHQNPAVAMNYFYEKIAATTALLHHEKIFGVLPGYDQLLSPVIKYYGNHLKLTSSLFFSAKSYHFVCGIVEFSNHLFVVLYFFDDTRQGIAAASSLLKPIKFFRLKENST